MSLQCRQPEALQLECLTEHGRGLQAKQPCPRINGARRDGRSTAAQLSCAAQCSARSGCSPQQHPVPTAGLLVLPLHFSCRSNVFFSSLSFGGFFFLLLFGCLVGFFVQWQQWHISPSHRKMSGHVNAWGEHYSPPPLSLVYPLFLLR